MPRRAGWDAGRQAGKSAVLLKAAEDLLALNSVFRSNVNYSNNEQDYRNFRRRAVELIGRLTQ